MATRILPIEEVIERTGLSRRTLYQEISDNRFPRGVQLTKRRVGWPEADVENWLSNKIAARDVGAAA
ncbi:AlpA family phage regulatory protein [Agrobacterium tumefaciens]|uniref:helix-turn-helix transcriptional regulator n=1 Tax=Agrobacterium TaxID=357 RepID=UPI001573B3FF|nr:AlpA family phage regulatory protein [Agrobacterium tumefaciens]NSZ00515.1 AlpA family phage regulatory protein [Agrobacterium tumefaciens]NSZ40198.1 AlpA family phage regulatory protein [Agrobacterium tumefaciens]NTB22791.1 AlpA family phage regulatory protein [Agrobacterium tumefaciens]NTB29301.1 AlpA family phage regulatory protein [Agrobacterium tumefaciens]NTB33203.1 AlpA family phage regulatory protein [Agrobacterium tumefaciens]